MFSIAKINHFLHRRFLAVILLCYGIAVVCPRPGMALREVHFGTLTLGGSSLALSLPTLLLCLLLFNAGLGIKTEELRRMGRLMGLMTLGVVINLLLPVLFAWGVSHLGIHWHNPDEVQNVLVGLALIAAMPIAASSTAWTQKSEGNLTLSLGMVCLSTLLSPLLTPIGLHLVGWMAHGDYSEDLHELAGGQTGLFLLISVILPTLLGALVRKRLGEERLSRAMPRIKLTSTASLLLLNYANAAIVLPQTFAQPDWDFLGITALLTGSLCALAFGIGWQLCGRSAPRSDRRALMFGLGMNNNGTGLTLAALALHDHPRVLLPILLYNVLQQIFAGFADTLTNSPTSPTAFVSPVPALPRASHRFVKKIVREGA